MCFLKGIVLINLILLTYKKIAGKKFLLKIPKLFNQTF